MYDKTSDRITLPMVDLFDLLNKAAEEGIRVGKADTEGDHTKDGIGYFVFREYMKNNPNPTGPVTRSGDL
jgi:hypothetical protein